MSTGFIYYQTQNRSEQCWRRLVWKWAPETEEFSTIVFEPASETGVCFGHHLWEPTSLHTGGWAAVNRAIKTAWLSSVRAPVWPPAGEGQSRLSVSPAGDAQTEIPPLRISHQCWLNWCVQRQLLQPVWPLTPQSGHSKGRSLLMIGLTFWKMHLFAFARVTWAKTGNWVKQQVSTSKFYIYRTDTLYVCTVCAFNNHTPGAFISFI